MNSLRAVRNNANFSMGIILDIYSMEVWAFSPQHLVNFVANLIVFQNMSTMTVIVCDTHTKYNIF